MEDTGHVIRVEGEEYVKLSVLSQRLQQVVRMELALRTIQSGMKVPGGKDEVRDQDECSSVPDLDAGSEPGCDPERY